MRRRTMREAMKEWLSQSRILLWIRYSRVFVRLWLWRRPVVREELVGQEKYYLSLLSNLLPGDHHAFDVGANEGWVTRILLKRGLAVTALDPDPRNARILKARFSSNKRFHFLPFAVGAGPGVLPFYRQGGATALSTLEAKWKQLVGRPGHPLFSEFEEVTEQVTVVALSEIIGEGPVPCLIKIDVEGYERYVLRGLNCRIPLLTFEANLPEFLPETIECLERLVVLDAGVRFNYSYNYSFGLAEYVDYSGFRRLLPELRNPCLDIICRMSNYFQFYRVDGV